MRRLWWAGLLGWGLADLVMCSTRWTAQSAKEWICQDVLHDLHWCRQWCTAYVVAAWSFLCTWCLSRCFALINQEARTCWSQLMRPIKTHHLHPQVHTHWLLIRNHTVSVSWQCWHSLNVVAVQARSKWQCRHTAPQFNTEVLCKQITCNLLWSSTRYISLIHTNCTTHSLDTCKDSWIVRAPPVLEHALPVLEHAPAT